MSTGVKALRVLALLGGLVTLPVATTQAAIIGYGDSVTFDAAFPLASFEGWDTYGNGASVPAGTVIMNGATYNGVTYVPGSGNAVITSAYVPTSGLNTLGITAPMVFGPWDLVTFTFPTPIFVFGIDITGAGNTNAMFTAYTNRGDTAHSALNPFPGSTTTQFIGFSTDQPFTSITISGVGQDVGFDSMRFVKTNIPEPVTLALLAVGVFGVAAHLRRRVV
ncbi:MAG: PEP-CTERM sorting domain-containing protein [Vicinamibacterales bacterium]